MNFDDLVTRVMIRKGMRRRRSAERYVRHQLDFAADPMTVQRLLGYSDPTGDQATQAALVLPGRTSQP